MRKSYKMIACKDGFKVSVQASEKNYCTPRNDTGPYESVELGFPSTVEPIIMPYCDDSSNPTETVYGWVPIAIVQAMIISHGGVASGELPPFNWTNQQSYMLAETLSSLGLKYEK